MKIKLTLRARIILIMVSLVLLTFLLTSTALLIPESKEKEFYFARTVAMQNMNKALELSAALKPVETAVQLSEKYILSTLDEDRIEKDSAYEKEYLNALEKEMIRFVHGTKNVVSLYFRLEKERFGISKGIFLTGNSSAGFVRVKNTNLQEYSPNDTEHVGWYYIPIWAKHPVWLNPHMNKNISTTVMSYVIPLYKNDELLGVVGMDINIAGIKRVIESVSFGRMLCLFIGADKSIVYTNRKHSMQSSVSQTADTDAIVNLLSMYSTRSLKRFFWDETEYLGHVQLLENGMSLVTAVPSSFLKYFRRRVFLLLCFVFFVMGIFVFLASLFSKKKIISPVMEMSDATFRLSRGELNTQLSYKSDNELGTLADNIRKVTVQMRDYFEYIRQQTEKERALKEVAISENKAKSAFLASMSHEIRTPINAILGMDEMILREGKDKTILEYATNIKAAGKNLLGIVNDVLDFSKIEAGKMELISENYDISSLVVDLVNMVSDRAKKKGLQFILKADPHLPKTLYGDSLKIKQSILNLLTNAVKYTKEGSVTFSVGFKKVETDSDKVRLVISVKDTGIGIKEEDMEKLCSPFERVEEEKNRTIEGTGLGISIVIRMLTMMGTSLDVMSEYGKGSEFGFSVEQDVVDWTCVGDISEAYKKNALQLGAYKEKLHAPKAHLLFVDDTEMNLEVVKALLKQTGMKLDLSLSGMDALELVKKNTYDILFIDHRMPEMDGIETLHEMKKMQDNLCKDKPCVALTANAVSGVKQMYLDEGFTDYLTKPVDPEKLEDMIRKYLPADYIEDEPDVEVDTSSFAEASYDDDGEFLQKVRELDFIDLDAALKNCAGAELFEYSLRRYYSEIDMKSSEIQNFYDCEDWKNYGTKVHGLKSTSRIVGIMALSQMAEHLEHCADNGDIQEIRDKHDSFMKDYLSLKEKLQELAEVKPENLPEISEEELLAKFKDIAAYASYFDIDGLDAIARELSEVKIPETYSEKYDKIRTCIENVDFITLRTLV